jgi:hypothetical protein
MEIGAVGLLAVDERMPRHSDVTSMAIMQSHAIRAPFAGRPNVTFPVIQRES